MDRRKFLHSALAAGAMLASRAALAASPNRGGVYVGGVRVPIIDIHAHCVVPAVRDLIAGTALSAIEFNPKQAIDATRIDAMNERRIDMQVLSINRYWWYRADRELADKIVRTHDESLMAWCERYPDRFASLSSVALQYPDLAARQLERAVTKLGSRGASIGGHVLGESLSLPKYDVFWRKVVELDVPVFMHPTGATNLLREHALDGSGDLGNIIGNPLETTVFLSQLIFDGTLDKFPQLKICVAHAGGYLPSYLGRTEVACDVRRRADCQNKKRPSEYLKEQIFIDTMVFSAEGLRHLVAEVGASQLVYGSDMPFDWPDMIDIVADSDFLSRDEKATILGRNLHRLLKLGGTAQEPGAPV